MIDTHAHLHLPDFAPDRDQVIARDFALGITGILEVCIGPTSWPIVRMLLDGDARFAATAGIHPHEAGRTSPAALRELTRRLAEPGVVAVGETGIDTYRDYAPLEDQRRIFAAQVGLARESGRPLVIHCREAFAPVFEILDREGGGGLRGVFHCFSGDLAQAREVHARGFRIGLGGAVTYAPDRWRPILEALPPSTWLLETDCPYLKPAPDRRGRNEPACVFQTAEVVAALLGRSLEDVERLADDNASELFGFDFAATGTEQSGGSAATDP